MICPKCGREIPDGTVCPCSMGAPVLSSNPAMNVIKTIGSSRMFLAAAILYSIGVLASFFSQILSTGDTAALLYSLSAQFDVDLAPLYPYLNTSAASTVVSAVCSSIFGILSAVAFWMHFATCRDQRTGNISTAGLTIWKVVLYITLISVCIAAGLLIIVAIILLAAGGLAASQNDFDSAGPIVVAALAIALLVAVAVLAFLIPYIIAKIKVINRTKQIAASGVPDDRVSTYLIVWSYIAAVCSIISALTELVSVPLMALSNLASGVGVILVAVCLTRFRREMNLLKYPAVQPVYPQPAPQEGPGPQNPGN